MPKKGASKRPTPSRNPPSRVAEAPRARASRSQPRSAGNPPIASSPSAQQLPEVLGGPYAAGEAAVQADDGDGVVVRGAAGEGRGAGAGLGQAAQEFGEQEVGEGGRGRVVVDEGRGQFQAGGGHEDVPQFDGGQRVEAEVAEGVFGTDGRGAGVSEDRRHLGAYQIQDEARARGRGESGEVPAQGRFPQGGFRCPGGLRGPVQFGQVADEGAGARDGERVRVSLPVDVREGQRRGVLLDRLPQGGEGEPGCHGGEAAAADAVLDAGAVGRHSGLGPGAPGQRGRGQAVGAAVFGEGVQEGVGGGVVALSGVRRGHRRRRRRARRRSGPGRGSPRAG